LTLHTDSCKPVHWVALQAVGVALNASSCGPCFETEAVFTCDLVTFQPSNGVMGHLCHELPSCQFWACFAIPFST